MQNELTVQSLLAEFLELSKSNDPAVVTDQRVTAFIEKSRMLVHGVSNAPIPEVRAKADSLRVSARVCMLTLKQVCPWLGADVGRALDAFIAEQPSHFVVDGKYRYTLDVVFDNFFRWPAYFERFQGKTGLSFLEIGSFEGQTACWLLDNWLKDDSSRLTCIDTFDFAGQNASFSRPDGSPATDLERRFDANIAATGAAHKVEKKIGRSQLVLRQLPLDHYDLVYVDGSHATKDVLEDVVLSWRLLKRGGVAIYDDYYDDPREPTQLPKVAIDAFTSMFRDELRELGRGDQQIAFEKL